MALLRSFCLRIFLLVSSMISFSWAEEPWSADPKLVQKLSKSNAAFNYDESKVPKFELPDALRLENGQSVSDSKQWMDQRRPELMDLFREHVYGFRPDIHPNIEISKTMQKSIFDDQVDAQEYSATIHHRGKTFQFPFAYFRPASAKEALPLIVCIDNQAFHSIEVAQQNDRPFLPIDQITQRGFAVVTFHTSNVDPDRADGYAEGVRSFLADGKPPTGNSWGSLSAWGWAASRLVDHFEKDPQIDANRIAVVGHSRGGKTALWAAAEDDRFKVAYSNQSGCGGAAISRRQFGETVARITTSFPHWFCVNFASFGGREHELPIDQHELVGLIAPRAVFVCSAAEDLWADPVGEYQSVVEAGPVFELFGQSTIAEKTMPVLGKTRTADRLGYRIRLGAHSLTPPDWMEFLDFAATRL
jgi:Prolyl oligopeptidase family